MRVRNNPQAATLLANSTLVIDVQQLQTSNWQYQLFANLNPIDLEIGMGKGQFLFTSAQNEPKRNFIGLEKNRTILLFALEKYKKMAIQQQLTNCYLINGDAEKTLGCFPKQSVSRIYLNFSDPWLKKRHQKRRLTAPAFLVLYHQLLKPNGQIYFKTDNQTLFYDSLVYFDSCHWKLVCSTNDLSNSCYNTTNVETEYEMKFKKMQKPIYFAIFEKSS